MDLVRRTALVLYSLSEQDRTWLLERLPASTRTVLAPLLQELRELGFPTQSDLLPSLVPPLDASHAAAKASDAEIQESAQPIAQLSLSPPRAIQAVLCNERDDFIAEILCLAVWPWEASVLAQMPVQRQLRIGKLKANYQLRAKQSMAAPMRRHALLQHVARAVEQCGVEHMLHPQVSQPAIWWSRLVARVMTLRGASAHD